MFTRCTSLAGLLVSHALNPIYAEEFSFNISAYEKKPYELNGHFDVMASQLNIDPHSAFTNLAFKVPDNASDFTPYNSELELSGLYRFDSSTLNFRSLSQWQNDTFDTSTEQTLQEGYWRYQPSDQWSFELGKRAIKWGKGYAWNPVGFLERPKNPDEPEINREGFVLASAEYTKSLPGLVKTVTTSFFAIPVSNDLNQDLVESNTDNLFLAGKLYLLIDDIDLDLYLRHSSETNTDFGVSFATNLATHFEIHGDFAYRDKTQHTQLTNTPSLNTTTQSMFQSLIGVRYLTESDLTWIAEWLHSPQGYSPAEMSAFFELAHSNPSLNLADYQLAQQAKQSDFGTSNPGQNYLYLRASQKDFADIVYLTAAITAIANTDDQSYLLTPELIYTGYQNSEVRFKATTLQGAKKTEFGEKLNDSKIELRLRLFF